MIHGFFHKFVVAVVWESFIYQRKTVVWLYG